MRNEKRGCHAASLRFSPHRKSLAPGGGVRLTILAARRVLAAAGDEPTVAATLSPVDCRAAIEILGHVAWSLDSARRLVSRALLSAADPILLEEGARAFAKEDARRARENAA